MKQTVVFEKTVTVTIEFEPNEPLSKQAVAAWLDWGLAQHSMVEKTIKEYPDKCKITSTDWEAIQSDPAFELR